MTETTEIAKAPIERLVAENIGQTIWLRLRRLTSPTLCRRILAARAKHLDSGALKTKADGIASAVRSALGYWESTPAALNAKILTRYYALLQLTIAEQITSEDPAIDLKAIQKHTESGHGLCTIAAPGMSFPGGYHIGCLNSGHFNAYCRYRRIDLGEYVLRKRLAKWEELSVEDQSKLISLTDLLRRVPELQPTINECLEVPPLSFHIAHSVKNMREHAQQGRDHGMIPSGPASNRLKNTYVVVYPHGHGVTEEYLNSLPLPIKDIQEEFDKTLGETYFVGTLTHPTAGYWWQYLKTYKSGYCGTSIIVPFWSDIEDPFIIHFMILYALSIVVRYLPSLWHEIEDGELDHIRTLIEQCLMIADNVLPRIAVERITGVRLFVDQPGSMGAPV